MVQGHFCDVRTMMPGRLKIRTTGEEHQEGSRGCLIDQQIQPFEGRRVCPVEVFQDKEHRLLFCVFQEDRYKRLQCFLSLALWGEVERRIAVFRQSEGQERCQQGYGFLDEKSVLAQRMFELPYLLVG